MSEISLKKIISEAHGRVQVYAGVLVALSVAVATGLALGGYGLTNPWGVGALCIAAALAQRGQVQLSGTLKVSISLFPILLAAVLFGPLAAMLVSVSSMFGEERTPRTRWVLLCVEQVTDGSRGRPRSNRAEQLNPSLNSRGECRGGALHAGPGYRLCGRCIHPPGTWSPLKVFRTLGPLAFTAMPLYVPGVALLAFGYEGVSPWVIPLFLAPALAAQKSFVLYQAEKRLAGDLAAANAQLERANLSFASALVATLDARDRYTAGHSSAVAIYSRDIAERMGLSAAQVQLVHLCGLVHDIGKIGLPPGLLEKPGALTLEERRQMEDHPVIGERILANVDDYAEIAKIVRHHHERVDGQGYPDGVVGDEIPLLSRIIAVADAYNAMTSDRPYRDAMPSQVARMRLAQAVESQFDTTVTAAFEAILASADETYRTGTRSDFDFEEPESGTSHRASFAPSGRSVA